jgi:hypothetical protein
MLDALIAICPTIKIKIVEKFDSTLNARNVGMNFQTRPSMAEEPLIVLQSQFLAARFLDLEHAEV